MKEIQLIKTLPVINMNFEEVKNSLQATISKYDGLVVTEEGLKDCKATQKELSKIKTTLDKYRIGVKKEMLVPVTEFEKQCKELISLVAAAENPIKEGILLFDNIKRQEKAVWAEELLEETMFKYNLKDFYKLQIDISDITINLSNSKKSIQEEIETKVKTLAAEQKAEEDRKQNCIDVMLATLESVNKNLSVPLERKDFDFLIEKGFEVGQIVKEINSRVDLIKKTEEDLKAKEQLRIIKAKEEEEKRIERIIEAEKEKSMAEEMKRVIEEQNKIEVKEVAFNGVQDLYSITLDIVTEKGKASLFKQFLIDNDITYNVVNQYKV